jgi:ABC-type Fe3+-hydroxamate transport system substrate-binding protein
MASFPLSLPDARGERLTLEAAPQRLVSLVPSQSELLAHLAEDRLAGVTRFCIRPDHLREQKEIVGGTKNVDVEQVKALQPDLVLANIEENTRETVTALEAFAPVFVTDVKSVPDAATMIRAVGKLIAQTPDAEALAGRLERAFADLGATDVLPLRAVYLIWRDPFMTVGRDTIIGDVMERAGFANAFADRTRYPEVSMQEIAEAVPEVVLLPDEPFPFPQKDRFSADLRDALPETPVEFVDGQLFSWYGPRLADAPPYLRNLRRQLQASEPDRS